MTDRRPLVAVALAAVLALAACSGAPTPPAPTSASGTVAPTTATVLGVGLYVADADFFGGSAAVAPRGFVEAVPGLHFGTLGPVDDGAFTLPIPDGADLPASTLVPAEQFLYNVAPIPDCTVVASDPTARVSAHAFQGYPVPGAYVVTFEDGARQALVADAAIDFDLPMEAALAGRSIVTWLYADAPVALALEGAGCTSGSIAYEVDLELRLGWNQVAWAINDTFDGALLRLDGTEELVLSVPDAM